MTRISNKSARHAALLAGAAMALPLWSMPALAQDAEEEANSNDIIVTAQKRSERLEEVPMAITVVTAQTLANAGVTSLRDLSSVTSGFSVGGGGAFPQPAIRGITTVINGTFENNVAVYIDGLYQPVAASINVDLPNVDNVQVLKGPQGTLYGRNATGGALLLTTADPNDDWKGKAEFTYARFDDKRGAGMVAGPLSDRVGISLAGYVRRSDGYIKKASRVTPGATECCAVPLAQDAFRAKLKGDLGALRATLAYSFTRVNSSATNVYSPIENVSGTLPTAANPAGTGYGRPGGATRPTTLGVMAYDIEEIMQTKQHEGGLTLELDTGAGTLKSVTGYSEVQTQNRFDFGGSYIPDQYSASQFKEKTFQQYLDFTSSAIDRVDLTVGASYFHDKLANELPTRAYAILATSGPTSPNVSTGNPEVPLSSYTVLQEGYFFQKKEAWAIYGDVVFHATDKLSLNVGGRYSEETQTVDNRVESILAASVRTRTNVSSKFSKFTPRASIRYEVGPRSFLSFSYSQGFRSGAYNSAMPTCVNTLPLAPDCYVPAKQESIRAYELGFKTAGSNYHLELAGFYYDYQDLQVSATRTLVIGGVNFPIVDITNAPKARVYGAEGSFEYEPMENLKVRGSATYLDAKYGDGFAFSGTGVCFSGPAGCGVGLNTNADPLKTYLNQGQVQNLSGKQMSRAPSFSANLGLEYEVPNGDGGLRFSANVKYTSSHVLTNPSLWCQPLASNNQCAGIPAERQGQQRFREGAYALLSASVTWTDPGGHYYVRVWGTNLANHRYRLHYTGTAAGSYQPMAEPLNVGGTIGYKF